MNGSEDSCSAPAIVCDNGTSFVKAGLASQDEPRVNPSLVGYPKPGVQVTEGDDICVGNEAISRRAHYSLKWPVEHGIVTDWDGMEKLWKNTFEELQVNPQEHLVLLTEAPLNPKRNREKMYEIMFEAFDVPAMHVGIQAVLSLYSAGRTTGLVMDSGGGVTHSVPVIDGYVPVNKATRMNMGGRDITEYLARLLRERNYQLYSAAHLELVAAVKEAHAYVAQRYDDELAAADAGRAHDLEREYHLPDGQVIALGSEQFRCAEVLFQPSLLGLEQREAIHTTLLDVIAKCDLDLHRVLYSSVMLSGGSSMFPGLEQRLAAEMRARVPPMMASHVKVLAPPGRKYAVWRGGAVLASLDTFAQSCVSRERYEEEGPDIVHQRL